MFFLLFGNSFKFYLFSAMSLSLSFKILYPCIELAEFKCGMTSTIFMAYFRQGKMKPTNKTKDTNQLKRMNNQINNLIPKILKFELSYIKMFIYTVYFYEMMMHQNIHCLQMSTIHIIWEAITRKTTKCHRIPVTNCFAVFIFVNFIFFSIFCYFCFRAFLFGAASWCRKRL